MTQYVTVTLKEFEAMREEIESGWSQAGSWDEDALKTINNAVRSARAIECRNKITPSPVLNDL